MVEDNWLLADDGVSTTMRDLNWLTQVENAQILTAFELNRLDIAVGFWTSLCELK